MDSTHLWTFLLGTAVGAAGTYMADRFTDQRRNQEGRRLSRDKFLKAQAMMPELFKEMRRDLSEQESAAIREFVVLPSDRSNFNHGDRARFEYYETTLPGAADHALILENLGYVKDVRVSNYPIYRMSEEFVEQLLAN